mmetsp:Transcript_6418/g.15451  ORF Transcript_6418/g.15451 Transcript_6418/m.15451 type:complete len:201 (+) Transcript_6418:407-1009(+)
MAVIRVRLLGPERDCLRQPAATASHPRGNVPRDRRGARTPRHGRPQLDDIRRCGVDSERRALEQCCGVGFLLLAYDARGVARRGLLVCGQMALEGQHLVCGQVDEQLQLRRQRRALVRPQRSLRLHRPPRQGRRRCQPWRLHGRHIPLGVAKCAVSHLAEARQLPPDPHLARHRRLQAFDLPLLLRDRPLELLHVSNVRQ